MMDNKYCVDENMINILENILGQNYSNVGRMLVAKNMTCNKSNSSSSPYHGLHNHNFEMLNVGLDIYAYVTPFLVAIGLFGNLFSLKVFTSYSMRKASASWYLSALAVSDTAVLLTYVLVDWLNLGMPRWPFEHRLPLVNYNGVCHTYLFCSYLFRFTSAWLIVIFTIERYIGVCRPLRRREICTNKFAKRAITTLVVFAMLFSLYKPFLSEVRPSLKGSICSWKTDYKRLTFILDTIYALSITAFPFMIIAIVNFLIVMKLIETRRRHRETKLLYDDSILKLEFTMILLVVSTCFVAFSLPYFGVWCYRFNQDKGSDASTNNPTSMEKVRGLLYITKTIFFINYSANFFLYSLTGCRFRKHVSSLIFCCGSNNKTITRGVQTQSRNNFGSEMTRTSLVWHQPQSGPNRKVKAKLNSRYSVGANEVEQTVMIENGNLMRSESAK